VRPSWLVKQQQQQKVVLTPELTANLIALLQQPDLLSTTSSNSGSNADSSDGSSSSSSSSGAVGVQKLSALTAGAPAVAQLLYELVLASRHVTGTSMYLALRA
jgi:hypothetical protein